MPCSVRSRRSSFRLLSAVPGDEPVVSGQVGPVVGDGAGIGIACTQGEGDERGFVQCRTRPVGYRPARGRDRVAETGGRACRAYRSEALREAFGIGLVEPCAHVLGEIGAYRRFPPGSGFGREHGHGQFRILQRGLAPSVYPGVPRDDLPGTGIGDLHAVPADGGQERPSVQRGACEVPVRVDVYLPVLVGPAALPSDRVERGGRQRHQRRAILPEHVPDGGAPAVMPRRGGQRIASVEHDPSELRVGLGLQRRDHEVAAEEPDRVLHRAFLPTGIGVAEPRVDAVVREERVEHRGERHLAPRVPASRAGGVVHDDHGRDAADVLEHLDQPVAQAFRVLPGQARHVPHVRMGERDDQAVVVHELAGDAGLRHTEIDLRDAGRPDELAVPVGTAPVRLAPASHVPQRRRVLAVVAGLRAEPVVHAFGGMALLARQHAVGLEPSVDQCRVRVDLGAPAPVHGRFRGHVVHISVFRDRGAVHVQSPRDLRPGHSLTVQSPDILLFGHRYRHRPFLPERRRLQPVDSFFGYVSGIYRHGGPVPVLVWAVIWCSSCWKPAAHTAEK